MHQQAGKLTHLVEDTTHVRIHADVQVSAIPLRGRACMCEVQGDITPSFSGRTQLKQATKQTCPPIRRRCEHWHRIKKCCFTHPIAPPRVADDPVLLPHGGNRRRLSCMSMYACNTGNQRGCKKMMMVLIGASRTSGEAVTDSGTSQTNQRSAWNGARTYRCTVSHDVDAVVNAIPVGRAQRRVGDHLSVPNYQESIKQPHRR